MMRSLLQNKKRLVVVLVLGLAVIFGAARILGQKSSQPQYQTATATRGTIVSAVSASGQVITTGRLPILSQASGQISDVYVKNGDTVSAGQKILLITLDPAAAAKNAAAWSSYLSARTSLDAANANINSLQSALFKANQAFVTDKGVPNPTDVQKTDPNYVREQADWLQAEANYKNQQAVIGQAQAAVASSWQSYQQTSPILVAPMAGTIADLTYVPGMLISSSISSSGITQSQTIASVVTDASPTIAINLSEVDVNRVTEGNRATVTFDALTGKTFTGRIVGINKTGVVTSGVTNYPATIQLDTSPTEILPNMSASASIVTASRDNVLTVPSEAIQNNGGQSTVRVLKNGQSQTVDVEVGLSSDTNTEITSGLSEGDVVITGTATAATSPTGQSPFSTFRVGGIGGGGGGFRTGGGGR